ncbi:MAG: hypothetical protein A2045_04410 [Rhodocyclales bacterium GWA2_65_20]|nr:MAG: hypothetical protein A2045_04410 [Rhodocyclales bacterium GWA2_65_20]
MTIGTPEGALDAGRAVDESAKRTMCLSAGVALTDLAVRHSADGQYLLIYCGDELVAMYGAMGGSAETVRFSDGQCYSIEDLLDSIFSTSELGE